MCGWGKENCLECGTQSVPSTEQLPKNAKPWDMSHALELPCSLLWNGFATTQVVTRVTLPQAMEIDVLRTLLVVLGG